MAADETPASETITVPLRWDALEATPLTYANAFALHHDRMRQEFVISIGSVAPPMKDSLTESEADELRRTGVTVHPIARIITGPLTIKDLLHQLQSAYSDYERELNQLKSDLGID